MKKSSIAVIGIFILIYILPLGVRPLFYPDETRYAEIPREMIASGDWVVPRINGLRYFEKPVLGYWLNATAMNLFGQNAFSLRFPSALGVGISALMVFLLLQRFAGGYSAGIIAAVVLMTCPAVFIVGVTNILDSVFSLFVTLTMGAFFFAYRETMPGKRMCFLVSSGIFCGLAFLTKGFVALTIPVVAIVPFMIWERQLKELLRVSWVPLITAVLIALPWCLMIHLREPDFWNHFFWFEHIKRFTSPNHGQHPDPFWFYFPMIVGGALPWSVLLPAVLPRLSRAHLKDSLNRFTLCWFLFPLLFFSASKGKLATYMLPCFPPLVMLITVSLVNYLAHGKQKALAIASFFSAALIGSATAVLLVNQLAGFPGFTIYGPGESWKWILVSCALLAWSLLLVAAGKTPDFRRKIIFYAAAPLLCMVCSHFILPEQLTTTRAPGAFLLSHAQRVTPETTLISDRRLTSAVCWFYKRDDVLLIDEGEFAYGLSCEDAQDRLLTIERFRKLFDKESGNKKIVLIIVKNSLKNQSTCFLKQHSRPTSGDMVFVEFYNKAFG